jgi:hypothetical protein
MCAAGELSRDCGMGVALSRDCGLIEISTLTDGRWPLVTRRDPESHPQRHLAWQFGSECRPNGHGLAVRVGFPITVSRAAYLPRPGS